MTTRFDRLLLVTSLVLAAACGDDSEQTTDATTGNTTGPTDTSADSTGEAADPQEYYDGELSAALGADGNQARCSTCHSMDGTLTGYSGQSLQDIAYKDSYKGGDADLLGAVNACVTGWMGGPALAADDPEFMALEEFFAGISDEAATTPNALMPEVLADEAEYETAYAGGDAAAGAALYDANCAVCHDAGLVVGSVPAYAKATLAGYTIGRIAQKVRTSGPPPSGSADAADSTPGPMPFFEAEELPAADLADIIAHLKG
ncbi:MAG: c-type cytochrome [Myxococcales bacterium]|nr:c-type cytochrome [Myxococcales bacterium]